MDCDVIYFAFVSSNLGGVEQKILGQYDAFATLGASLHLVLVSTSKPGELLAKEIERRPKITVLTNSPAKSRNPWIRRREKFELMSNWLSQYGTDKTLVYLRFPLADPLLNAFLLRSDPLRVVTEHQDLENKLRTGRFGGTTGTDLIDLIWGRMVRRKISGFVGISRQCVATQLSYLPKDEQNRKPALVNGNGIHTDRYPVRSFSGFDGQTLRLLFVGTGYRPHGLHRVLASLEQYYASGAQVKIIVNIAGASPTTPGLLNYLRNPSVRKSVIFHGYLTSSQIDPLADSCHVAVNSLSLHTIGMTVSSSLKSKEYFARGIPYIASSPDTDIPDSSPFILNVSADEKPFDLLRVIEFAERLNRDTEHPAKMRQFSFDNLDWIVKARRLVDFFDDVMRSGR